MKASHIIKFAFSLIIIFSCSNNLQTSKYKGIAGMNHDSTSHNYLDMGFELIQNEKFNNIKIGLKPDSIKFLLGEPDSITTPEEWAALGTEFQSYLYNSIGLKLDLILNPDSVFSVETITLYDPCTFKSTRGIGIGSRYEEVQKSYQRYIDPNTSDSNNIVAGSVYGGILFKFQDRKVKSIFLGAAAD